MLLFNYLDTLPKLYPYLTQYVSQCINLALLNEHSDEQENTEHLTNSKVI